MCSYTCISHFIGQGVLGGSSLSPGQGPEGEDSDVDVFHAECYLQKPSPQDMVAAGVLLASEEREQRSGEKKQMSWTQTQDASFMTLIDTGLVLACGRAFQVAAEVVSTVSLTQGTSFFQCFPLNMFEVFLSLSSFFPLYLSHYIWVTRCLCRA